MLMLALGLILKKKDGKLHCLPFAGSNLGVEIFLKKREHQKGMRWNRLRYLCILCIGVSRKFYANSVSFVKSLFSFIPWLLTFPDLPSYNSNSRKRYTLRILSKCLGRTTSLALQCLFDFLRWAPFSLALHLCSS